GDGSEWTVCEDWEANTGLVNDVFQVMSNTENDDDNVEKLLHRFREEPVFVEVIQAIMNMDGDEDERKRRRARHRAEQYSIDNGKLWRIRGGTTTRGRHRTECITKKETVEKAREVHQNQGHWGRDVIKITLMDKYWSPKMDASILEGIQHCAR
ncbi:hypothetical protein GY45DRAFT_1230895, partial [Cubamyces sp. BRFM 1775]